MTTTTLEGEQAGQLDAEVIPGELEEIHQRRLHLGLEADDAPPADPYDMDLMGLALSGGGIRSSTIGLGVLQALARGSALARVDYLSTVSGGGFIGGCLSSTLNEAGRHSDPENFPLRENTGGPESNALSQLRTSGRYLAPQGLLEKLRIPALLVRGMLINLVLIFPMIVIAVLLTELWAEYFGHGEDLLVEIIRFSTVAFFMLGIVPPYLSFLFVRHLNWKSRQRYEHVFIFFLMVALTSLAIYPLTLLIEYAIDITWGRLIYQTLDDISLVGDSAFFWLILLVCIVLLGLAGRASRNLASLRNRIALYVASLVGPALIFLVYALLCVWQIDSPYIHLDARYFLTQSEVSELENGEFPEKLLREMNAEDQQLGLHAGEDINVAVAEEGHWLVDDSRHRYRLRLDQRVLTVENLWLVPQIESGRMNHALEQLLLHKGLGVTMDTQVTAGKDGGWALTAEGEQYQLSKPSERRILITPQPRDVWDAGDQFFYGGAILVMLLNWIFVNVNFTSLHSFYRDQLTRGFLFRKDSQHRSDAGRRVKLSALNTEGSTAPYQLLNMTLNLQGSDDVDLRGRGADFFLMSRHWVGSARTGFVPTEKMESVDPNLELGAAMAISGAAASPNMGSVGVKALAFLLTLLNLRLDYWLPNPRYVSRAGWFRRFLLKRGAGPWYVFREAVGALNSDTVYVNLSDGGHLENMGIYPLLQRRCRTIICSDGEADPGISCAGLIKVVRLAAIDLGVNIDIDLSPLARGAGGFSDAHFIVGKIDYGQGRTGTLYYIKSSLTGDENPYVLDYHRRSPDFPHESTAEQFFTEEQFEAYRALGSHMADGLLAAHPELSQSGS